MKTTKKTAKIKVTVTHEEVKEMEISFPYFVNDGAYYCKFISKDKAITVTDYSFSKAIEYRHVPESWIANEPITEEEFNAKFNEVMNDLIKINNEKTI